MHTKIKEVQQHILDLTKETLEILEIKNNRIPVLIALGVSEKPLNAKEITDRTKLNSDDVKNELNKLLEKQLITKLSDNKQSSEALYEIAYDANKIVNSNIKAKVEKISKNTRSKLNKIIPLLNNDNNDFDEFDRLMSRYLHCKIRKVDLFNRIVTKRLSLLNFLDSNEPDEAVIKKVDID